MCYQERVEKGGVYTYPVRYIKYRALAEEAMAKRLVNVLRCIFKMK